MRLRPDIISLLEFVRDLLQTEFPDDATFENRRYETLMMANALTIAARQVDSGRTPNAADLDSLQALIGESNGDHSLDAINRLFSAQIRNGEFDPGTADHRNAWKFLNDDARGNLLEYNPKYLGDQ